MKKQYELPTIEILILDNIRTEDDDNDPTTSSVTWWE